MNLLRSDRRIGSSSRFCNSKLKRHPFSAVTDCLFCISIPGNHFFHSNLKTCHCMVTGNELNVEWCSITHERVLHYRCPKLYVSTFLNLGSNPLFNNFLPPSYAIYPPPPLWFRGAQSTYKQWNPWVRMCKYAKKPGRRVYAESVSWRWGEVTGRSPLLLPPPSGRGYAMSTKKKWHMVQFTSYRQMWINMNVKEIILSVLK